MYDIGAEAGVIGSLIKKPSLYYLFERLQPSHFYEKTNAVLYDVLHKMIEDGSEDTSDYAIYIRLTTQKHYLKVFEDANVDVQSYIQKVRLVGTTDEGEYVSRAKRVIDLAYRRDSTGLLESLAKQAKRSKVDANTLHRQIITEIDGFAESYLSVSDIKPLSEMVDELWDEIVSSQNPELGISGLPSCIPIVNQYFSYERGELIVIGARPKVLWVAM